MAEPIPLSEALRIRQEKLRAELAEVDAAALRLKGLESGTSAALEAPEDEKASRWLHPADVLRTLRHSGTRFPTGFRTLDEVTRGGIQRGRVVTIVGQPGAGKTGLALQIAAGIADRHPETFVALYLDDEGTESGVIRLAQHSGASRDLIEAADPEAISEAAAKLDKRQNLLCYDGEQDTANLLDFMAESQTQAGDRLEVWVIDSAQVIAPGSAGPAKDRRLTVAEVAETVRKRTRKRGAITFLLSQSNRASYRKKKTEENSDPISAGAETAAIEFNADVLLFMAGSGVDVSTVVVPKNRLGPRHNVPFSITWNRASATFSEPMLEPLAEDAGIKKTRDVKAWAARVSKACEQHPEGLSGEQVREVAALNGTQWKAVREHLEQHHLLRHETRPGKGGGVLWFSVDAG